MAKNPKVGAFLDDEEEEFIELFEGSDVALVSGLTDERRKEIEAMARSTMNDEREKISLRVSRADLVRLKSRAMQEGIPYQTLINSLIHKYVSS
ncbi:DNA-binding protein [Rhizobium sp. BG4]|jgi:predicted DNA binding CopG/RHH family protein|uniref:DNA-binding protein n=1 Tax=Rhizobium sp. BG4 TaxID=2613770 RepID=UPI001029F5E2|nr:DNA-binding protein [Rhizobium sp. BG4]QRM44851.1 DNA-binding protein [Rhizobium sp. BG4]